MEKLVVLNGINASGKTTLAKEIIASNPEFSYFDEIGLQLRRNVSYSTMTPVLKFEFDVMKLENHRDHELKACDNIPIVETWHIGNYAYAMNRNPSLKDIYSKLLEHKRKEFEVICIFLDISKNTLEKRLKAKIEAETNGGGKKIWGETSYEFFESIRNHLLEAYNKFDFKYFHIENDGTLGACTNTVLSVLKRI